MSDTQALIDHEPDPEQSCASRMKHAHDLSTMIVGRINGDLECFHFVKNREGHITGVLLTPIARVIIESYLRENL
jgi:hypothetical protein